MKFITLAVGNLYTLQYFIWKFIEWENNEVTPMIEIGTPWKIQISIKDLAFFLEFTWKEDIWSVLIFYISFFVLFWWKKKNIERNIKTYDTGYVLFFFSLFDLIFELPMKLCIQEEIWLLWEARRLNVDAYIGLERSGELFSFNLTGLDPYRTIQFWAGFNHILNT